MVYWMHVSEKYQLVADRLRNETLRGYGEPGLFGGCTFEGPCGTWIICWIKKETSHVVTDR